ncbi:MAG: hypothetical protein V7K92_03050 [Nostoc sp.]|uniref:hypothetical protein n=1 Tax=Nostoc sp. TaxID=1180 RepID=UPI002FF22362
MTLVRLWRLPFSQRERLRQRLKRVRRSLRRSKHTSAGKQATRSVSKSCHAAGFTLRYRASGTSAMHWLPYGYLQNQI